MKKGEQKIPIQGILKLTKVFIYHTNNFKLMTRATNIFNILKPEIPDNFELAIEEQQYMQLLELKYTQILRKKPVAGGQTSEALPMKDDSDGFDVNGAAREIVTEAAAGDVNDHGRNRRGGNLSKFAKAPRGGESTPLGINPSSPSRPDRASRRHSTNISPMGKARINDKVPDPICALEKIIAGNDEPNFKKERA